MKITEALTAEHAVFFAQLDQLEKMMGAHQTLGELKAVSALLAAALQTHAGLEDDLLFAALEHCLDQMGKLETVHHDHDAILDSLSRIQTARTRAEAQRHLHRVIQLARHEFDLEERIIFPMAEGVLRAETLTKLGKAWARQRGVIVR